MNSPVVQWTVQLVCQGVTFMLLQRSQAACDRGTGQASVLGSLHLGSEWGTSRHRQYPLDALLPAIQCSNSQCAPWPLLGCDEHRTGTTRGPRLESARPAVCSRIQVLMPLMWDAHPGPRQHLLLRAVEAYSCSAVCRVARICWVFRGRQKLIPRTHDQKIKRGEVLKPS